MKISVVTPSVRPDLISIVSKCLSRQTFQSFEWIIGTPNKMVDDMKSNISIQANVVEEPPKRENDFYRLCGCLNKCFAQAQGELIVVIMDGNWFKPDLLERLWGHYLTNKSRLITAVGDQFSVVDSRGEPSDLFWVDPRRANAAGRNFYEVGPDQMEFSLCSIPKKALDDCGGFDEDYDKGPAVGEKEMSLRIKMLGFELYIDQTIEYKAIHHPRLTTNWDDMYFKVTAPLFTRHVKELGEGTRPLNVNSLVRYNKLVTT